MAKDSYYVIGVMSGTSLDGIDLAYCSFTKHEKWNFGIHAAKTISYNDKWYDALKNAINLSTKELQELDLKYSCYLGKVIRDFISENDISNLDFIASHGHTVLHRPDLGFTYQIGNTQVLADTSDIKVICDFRVQDVKLGGQGAPLVPIGDMLLFNDYDYCLNLGGFANVSFQDSDQRIAFDICPANLMLNYYASTLNMDYDNKGEMAASGSINSNLLIDLNTIPFYNDSPPKSLGLEWVQENILPLVDSYKISTKDVLRTLVEHIAIQISKVINAESKKVLVTGGGAFNDFLIQSIANYSKSNMVLPEIEIINFKEAIIFGFLGVLRDRSEVNCLKSVTGAQRNHSSGVIFLPEIKIND